MLTAQLILTTVLLAGPADFEARLLDGQTVQGALVALDERQLVLDGADGRTTLAIEKLSTVARGKDAQAQPPVKPTLWVELVDESGLAATAYTVKGNVAKVTTTIGAVVDVPTRQVRWVRFRVPGGDEKLDKQWSAIADTKAGGDLLVVRKSDALDYLEGIQGDIDDQTCKFELDGEVIPVKREKVEGVVYVHPAPADLPEATGRVTSFDGAQLAVTRATLAEGTLKIETPAGVQLSLPIEQVSRLDYSAGKIAYLSDLSPESATYLPFFGFKNKVPALGEFFEYRRDTGFDRSPLRVDGQTYNKGLALQSRTTLVYKLPGKFRLFKTVAGIDDSVRPAGSAKLEIKADGKPVWQGTVRGDEPAQELEVDITGARRLEIVADFGDDLDIGDRVDLCEARVTK